MADDPVVRRTLAKTPGKKDNWVERSKVSGGKLPRYITFVAGAIRRGGVPTSKAIRIAVGKIRDWAEGRGDVSEVVRARAKKAIAEWDAMRAEAHGYTAAPPADVIELRNFTHAERMRAAATGHALPDGSYPIYTRRDLRNAVKDYHRTKNRYSPARKAQVRKHILSWAARLGVGSVSLVRQATRGKAPGRASTIDLASAPVPPDSAMIALQVPADVARHLAVAGGLPAADLHVTLAFLGRGLTRSQRRAAVDAARRVAAMWGPLSGSVGGIGQFPPGPDGVPVWVPVDVPRLGNLRSSLVAELDRVGVPVAQDHGFTPHVTLAYPQRGQAIPPPVPATPVMFGGLTVAVGPRHVTFPFGRRRPVPLTTPGRGDVVELAANHPPPYDWRHGWIPTNLRTALKWGHLDRFEAHRDRHILARALRKPMLQRLSDESLGTLYSRYSEHRGGRVGRVLLSEVNRRDYEASRKKAMDRLRDEYQNFAHAQYLQAVDYTKGYLLNKRGEKAGVDEQAIFRGSHRRAHAYASEELENFWKTHPRYTFAEFVKGWRQQPDDEMAA